MDIRDKIEWKRATGETTVVSITSVDRIPRNSPTVETQWAEVEISGGVPQVAELFLRRDQCSTATCSCTALRLFKNFCAGIRN